MPTLELRWHRDSLLRNVLFVCAGIEMLLFMLDYHLNYSAHRASSAAIRKLFNTAREDGLAGWFAIMQTAMVALTVWFIYLLVRRSGSRLQRTGWLVLAAFFTYLAFDDGAHIHERVGTWYHDAFTGAGSGLAARTLELFPSYRWQIVFMPVFAAAGVFMFLFLLRQLHGWRGKVLVTVALALLATAVALDFFEGLAPDHPWNPYTAITNAWQLDYWTLRTFRHTPYDTLEHFSRSLEETIEMFAMTLLWVVFLAHATRLGRDLHVRFEAGAAAGSTAQIPAASPPVARPSRRAA